jgi:hypothetical protein
MPPAVNPRRSPAEVTPGPQRVRRSPGRGVADGRGAATRLSQGRSPSAPSRRVKTAGSNPVGRDGALREPSGLGALAPAEPRVAKGHEGRRVAGAQAQRTAEGPPPPRPSGPSREEGPLRHGGHRDRGVARGEAAQPRAPPALAERRRARRRAGAGARGPGSPCPGAPAPTARRPSTASGRPAGRRRTLRRGRRPARPGDPPAPPCSGRSPWPRDARQRARRR